MTVRRVLHIVGCMDRAGAETMLMNLYREIDRSRIQFDFVYFTLDRCDYDDEIEALGGQILRISAGGPAGRFLAMYNLLRTGRWQIVHSHPLFSSGLHLNAARLAGVPHRIAHSHSTQDKSASRVWGYAYLQLARLLIGWSSTRVVACGIAAANYLFPGRSDVVMLRNAIDIGKFSGASGAELRAQLGSPPGQLLVIHVARFAPEKNHVHSIRVAGEMRDAGIDFQLLLIGVGPEMPAIQQLVSENDLASHVRFLGSRSDIPELMNAADVMILPSFYEGFGVVLVEAQAAGLVSVVSTGVPHEVDLGMGMVLFLGLEATLYDWMNALRMAATCDRPSVQERTSLLDQEGFSSAAGARLLEEFYFSP